MDLLNHFHEIIATTDCIVCLMWVQLFASDFRLSKIHYIDPSDDCTLWMSYTGVISVPWLLLCPHFHVPTSRADKRWVRTAAVPSSCRRVVLQVHTHSADDYAFQRHRRKIEIMWLIFTIGNWISVLRLRGLYYWLPPLLLVMDYISHVQRGWNQSAIRPFQRANVADIANYLTADIGKVWYEWWWPSIAVTIIVLSFRELYFVETSLCRTVSVWRELFGPRMAVEMRLIIYF